jgi:hypothetical protein
MCTVSFLARKNGYALAMNRDEKLTRIAGLPPTTTLVKGRKVICPSEPGGGTWIALNDAGATLALINWYSIEEHVLTGGLSRGDVVKSMCAAATVEAAASALDLLPLSRMNPFRLVGIFPCQKAVAEWRWDLKLLTTAHHPWRARQWISSGFNEPEAQRVRGAVFRRAREQSSFGGLDWLRRLHRSHLPEAGPFSTCMHRADAATVSYTEIQVAGKKGQLTYCPVAPCQSRAGSTSRNRPKTSSLKIALTPG